MALKEIPYLFGNAVDIGNKVFYFTAISPSFHSSAVPRWDSLEHELDFSAA